MVVDRQCLWICRQVEVVDMQFVGRQGLWKSSGFVLARFVDKWWFWTLNVCEQVVVLDMQDLWTSGGFRNERFVNKWWFWKCKVCGQVVVLDMQDLWTSGGFGYTRL